MGDIYIKRSLEEFEKQKAINVITSISQFFTNSPGHLHVRVKVTEKLFQGPHVGGEKALGLELHLLSGIQKKKAMLCKVGSEEIALFGPRVSK